MNTANTFTTANQPQMSTCKKSKKIKFKVVQEPYLDYPKNISWHEQEKRRTEMFLGCCCYGCGGDECGDGK